MYCEPCRRPAKMPTVVDAATIVEENQVTAPDVLLLDVPRGAVLRVGRAWEVQFPPLLNAYSVKPEQSKALGPSAPSRQHLRVALLVHGYGNSMPFWRPDGLVSLWPWWWRYLEAAVEAKPPVDNEDDGEQDGQRKALRRGQRRREVSAFPTPAKSPLCRGRPTEEGALPPRESASRPIVGGCEARAPAEVGPPLLSVKCLGGLESARRTEFGVSGGPVFSSSLATQRASRTE